MSPREFRSRLSSTGRLSALWGVAISIPLYLELAGHPAVMINRGFQGSGLVFFTFLVGWLPLLSLCLPTRKPAILKACVASCLTLLTALGALRPVASVSPLGYVLLVLALTIGALVIMLNNETIRRVLPWLGLLSLLSPLVFLGTPSVHPKWIPRKAPNFPPTWSNSTTPVVLVVFDELPLDILLTREKEICEQLYPNFASFSEQAHWFRETTTVCDYTELAVPALLTGRYPRRVAASYTNYPKNLYTYLANRPLKTLGLASKLSPDRAQRAASLWNLTQDGLLLYLHRTLPAFLAVRLPARDELVLNDSFDPLWREPNRVPRYRAFIESLGELPNELVVMHMMLPHSPMEFYSDGTRYNVEEIFHPFFRPPGEWSARLDQQRHILQTQLADHLLGELVDQLKSKGLYRKSIIVVTADHGADFQEGESRRHVTPHNYPSILRVPLLLKLPESTTAKVDERPVETIDLLPTLAGLLGGTVDPEWDGADLLASSTQGRETKKVYLVRPDLFVGATTEPWKLYRNLALPVSGGVAQVNQGILSLANTDIVLAPSLEEKARRFGEPPRPFQVGPFPELLGRPISEFKILESQCKASLEYASSFEDVDPASGFLPGLLVAELDLTNQEPVPVAAELNGILCATGWTRPEEGRHQLRVLLPPTSFKSGRNIATVHLLEREKSGQMVLRPASKASLGRLEAGTIVTNNGRYPLTGGHCGEWHSWLDADGDLRLDGWAHDFKAGFTPDFVSVFRRTELIARTRVDISAAQILNSSHRRSMLRRLAPDRPCGFALEMKEETTQELRVFAHFPGRAVELRRSGNRR